MKVGRNQKAVAFLLAGIASIGLSCDSNSKVVDHPNVLLILIDTLRADYMSMYGYPRPTTPRLEAFAKESVVFNNAAAQATCTFPSVNSLFTSRYPWVFVDQVQKSMGIPDEIPTLATILRKDGYRTVALSASPIVRKNPSSSNPTGGFDQGFDEFDDECRLQPASCVLGKADRVLEGLTEPLFLYLHLFDPHDGYNPPAEFAEVFVGPYEGKDYVAKGNPNPIQKMAHENPEELKELQPADIKHLRDLYAAEIASADAALGNFLERLSDQGILEQSVVVITSDHGEEFLEHEQVKHCRSVYDSLARVPLMIRLPGGQPRGTRDALAQNLDVLPTLLDFIGISTDAYHPEGRSLRAAMETDGAVNAATYTSQGRLRAIRRAEFKLIVDQQSGKRRLFDVVSDPQELRDLSEGREELIESLYGDLQSWEDATRQTIGGADGRGRADEIPEERLRALGYLE